MKKFISEGYVYIKNPKHPNARKNGYISEHRLIMSELINRPLYEDEEVHHIDGNGLNNDSKNLRLERKSTHKKINHLGSNLFSEEQLRKIVEEYKSGISSVKLAKKYNCTPNIILYWVRNMGFEINKQNSYKRIGKSKLSDKEWENLYKEYCERKLTVKELAKKYNLSLVMVPRGLKSRGYKIRKNRWY